MGAHRSTCKIITMSILKAHAFRLFPGDDLKVAIQEHVNAENMLSGWVATCVGSLKQVSVRFANQQKGEVLPGPFEILTLTGNLSASGCHLHICVADKHGHTMGGHLLEGTLVFTTAEIVLMHDSNLRFSRQHDDLTGFNELCIHREE